MRLGVDLPELGALVLLTDVVTESLDGVRAPWPSGVDCFIAECGGGEGGRVDEECLTFVKSRETDAVAVDVLAWATGAGVRGRKAGGRMRRGSGGGGCSSRIFRRLWMVRFVGQLSEEDDSSVGGVIERGRVVIICLGVCEREERQVVGESLFSRPQSGDLCTVWLGECWFALLRSALLPLFLEFLRDGRSEGMAGVKDKLTVELGDDEPWTNDDSIL